MLHSLRSGATAEADLTIGTEDLQLSQAAASDDDQSSAPVLTLDLLLGDPFFVRP
jgi:hypothetical protein